MNRDHASQNTSRKPAGQSARRVPGTHRLLPVSDRDKELEILVLLGRLVEQSPLDQGRTSHLGRLELAELALTA
jgi:hypothetical protein